MIVREALFEGKIHEGREAEFRSFVEERLVPLWRQFPGAKDIQVQFGTERDEGAPIVSMVLSISYPDMETCNKALQSPVRFESREVTGELLKMFTGRVHHHVFEATRYAPPE